MQHNVLLTCNALLKNDGMLILGTRSFGKILSTLEGKHSTDLKRDIEFLDDKTSNENKRKLLNLICPNPKVIGSKVILEPISVFKNIKNMQNLNKLETRGVEPLSKMD